LEIDEGLRKRIRHLQSGVIEQLYAIQLLLLPLLISVFTGSAALIITESVGHFWPGTLPQWFAFYIIFIVFEATYLTYAFARLRPPASVRLLECVTTILILKSLLIWSGVDFGYEVFWQQLLYKTTWTGTSFIVPGLVTAWIWWLATAFAADFIWLNPPGLGFFNPTSWSATYDDTREARQHRLRRHVASYQRIIHRVFRSALAIVLIYGAGAEFYPDLAATGTAWKWRIILYAAVFVFGFWVLIASAHLLRMRNVWSEVGITVADDLPSKWLLGTLAAMIPLLVVGLLLPANISPLSMVGVLNFLFRWTKVENIGLLSQYVNAPGQHAETSRALAPSGQRTAPVFAIINSLATLAAAALVTAAVIAVVGWLIRVIYRRELGRLPAFLKFPVMFYLYVRNLIRIIAKSAYRAWLRFLRGPAVSFVRRLASSGARKHPRASDRAPGVITRLRLTTIRSLYASLLLIAKERGFFRRPHQTAKEYGRNLAARLEEGASEVERLTDLYLEARYSRHDPGKAALHMARQWFAIVRNAIRDHFPGTQ